MTAHAVQRASERYNARMTNNDRNILLMKIACGDASFVREVTDNEIWLVWWDKVRERVAVVVSPDHERILTILPREQVKNTALADRLKAALRGGADAA